MSVMAVDLERARSVKDRLTERLRSVPEVTGVGLVRRPEGGWGVKVNLIRAAPHLKLPSQIDGVDVVTDVTGPIVSE